MGIDIHLYKGYITDNDDSDLRCHNIIDGNYLSIKLLDHVESVKLQYKYPAIMNYLIHTLETSSALDGVQAHKLIEDHFIGINKYVIETLLRKLQFDATMLGIMIDTKRNQKIINDFGKELDYNKKFVQELADLRDNCIDYNRTHQTDKVLPMISFDH